jgi:hypothetical protein
MDQNIPPAPNQNVNVFGDNNTVIIAGRDVVNPPPPPPTVPPFGSKEGGSSGNRRPGGSPRRFSKLPKMAGALLAILLLATPTLHSGWPEGKTAVCNDGWFSASHTRSGTCSSHGGVLEWRYPASHAIWRHRESPSLALAR